MTWINEDGAHALSVKTDFDGCQAIVKDCFEDLKFKEKETVQETFNLSESISEPKKVGAFKLPSLDFLRVPEKKVKNAKEEKKVDADFLEKVLLDLLHKYKIIDKLLEFNMHLIKLL